MTEFMDVHNMQYHVATIYRRNKPIATARNRVGSRMQGCGWSDMSLHAERAVVKSLGDLSQLRGCKLEVIRLNKRSEIRNSEPCSECHSFLEKCMKKYGLISVSYSINPENMPCN